MTAPMILPGVFTSTQFNALAQYVDDTRVGIVARGNRTSTSTTTTTEVGVLRLDDIPIVGGLSYSVLTNSINLQSSVAADTVEARIRYTTDGSTPTTSSTIMPGSPTRATIGATGLEVRTLSAVYSPASDQTLSVLLTIARTAGTGNASVFGSSTNTIDLYVWVLGTDPGDSGVDV